MAELDQEFVNKLLHGDPAAEAEKYRQARLLELTPRNEDEARAVLNVALSYPNVRDEIMEMARMFRAAADSAQAIARVISDLDRCEHGRHAKDSCLMCPGGKSTGNLLLEPGRVIGHTVHGRPIVVPAPGFDWMQRSSWMGDWPPEPGVQE
jgi:hypothetical protein